MQSFQSISSVSRQSLYPGVTSYSIGGATFDLPDQYEPIEYINKGANGVVCSGIHKPTGRKVAIKKISNIFQSPENSKRLLREIKLLRHFDNEQVLSILDIFKPPSRELFNDLYIVTDLMDTDLEVVISSGQGLSEDHVKYFMYQLLCAVKYIHSADVLHRDIKPSNILCNEDCTIKLADFGLARVQHQWDDMTEYVATRWYRAPEVILSWKEYTKKIDIWSVGCILAELFCGRPIFQGKDYLDQIFQITNILGSPSIEYINMLTSERAREFLYQMGRKAKIPWPQIFSSGSPEAYDLLDKMLEFNPDRRCTVEEALAHPFFISIREASCEVNANTMFSFDHENWAMTKEVCKNLFYSEICHFHPEAHHEIPREPSPMSPTLRQQTMTGSGSWPLSPGSAPLTPNSAIFAQSVQNANEISSSGEYESAFTGL